MSVKFKGLDRVQSKFAQLSKDFESFPRANNPLLDWKVGYSVRGVKAGRPAVSKAGTYRGNRWPGLKIMYKRKTDGVAVPVWGGVKRLRRGTVTRATGTGIRVKAAGPGVVKKGQTFSGNNVLGKLKNSGQRYKRGDKQLGKIRPQGLLGDWFQSDPKLSSSGKKLTITTNKPHAARIAAKRPFHWGRTIARIERHHLELVAAKWLFTRIRRRA